jgi:hypothetical protein
MGDVFAGPDLEKRSAHLEKSRVDNMQPLKYQAIQLAPGWKPVLARRRRCGV